MQIPIKLFDNCENKFKDGKYEIILEGLDKIDKQEIIINGMNEKLCKEVIIKNETKVIKTETKSINIKENKPSENIINNSKVTGLTVYQNSNEKAMRSAIYFFAFILLLIIIGVFVKKEWLNK